MDFRGILQPVMAHNATYTALFILQERLAASHGTQCGFCSPGMVMSMYTLLRNNPEPTKADIRQAIEGEVYIDWMAVNYLH